MFKGNEFGDDCSGDGDGEDDGSSLRIREALRCQQPDGEAVMMGGTHSECTCTQVGLKAPFEANVYQRSIAPKLSITGELLGLPLPLISADPFDNSVTSSSLEDQSGAERAGKEVSAWRMEASVRVTEALYIAHLSSIFIR